MYKISLYLALFIFLISCSGNNSTPEERIIEYISFLASDDLEGREAGTESEREAALYISEQFNKVGLLPKGDNGSFEQTFEFQAGKVIHNLSLKIENEDLSAETKALNYSGNGVINGEVVDLGFGIKASDLDYDDYIGKNVADKIVLINISSPDGIHPHSKYISYHSLKERARLAATNNASGVIFYNNDPTANDPKPDYTKNVSVLDIPVIFYEGDRDITGNVSLEVNIETDSREARNVIGYLDNSAETSVIIGAHFDHLGYGVNGGSLYRGDSAQIHNGADDNASGTALLIELANDIINSELTGHNYLFIAFSGEEKGLLGANYFTENPTIDLSSVAYMINMDMVGRLDPESHDLAINGVGTSPTWKQVLNEYEHSYFKITASESGIGPSDHTSFYLADIPVLHFFTGAHEDYHKPTDDTEKINIEGMIQVKNLIMDLNQKLDDSAKIIFTKTKDAQSRSAPKFSVTLGVVPDYMYSEKGLKLDGITDGKAAANAGLKSGDIITQMGDLTIDDIYSYMNALSVFKKGETIQVTFTRDGKEQKIDLTF